MTPHAPIRTALASFGMSGYVFHAPLLEAHPGFALSAILERNQSHSREKYSHARLVRSYQELLDDPTIELIVVNTPDVYHLEMAVQALRKGKHVVVEKPFTLTYREAAELEALAKSEGKLLSVFQNRRWDGDFLTVQKLIKEKVLGEVIDFQANYDRYRNYVQANTWKEDPALGTGLLYNLGSHLIDQALTLFGLPEKVWAELQVNRPGGQVTDQFFVRFLYPGALRVTLKSGYLVRENSLRFQVHGTLGSFIKHGIDPQEEALKLGEKPGGPYWGREPQKDWGVLHTQIGESVVRGKVETEAGNYLAYYEQLFGAIREGKQVPVQASEGAQVIRVIEACMASHQAKIPVDL